MNPNLLLAFLQVITAAVTPVVMLATCSTLILGINAKHAGLSDRIRGYTLEFRQHETGDIRRGQILREILIFQRRFRYTWVALCTLYGAVIFFILTTLFIIFLQNKLPMPAVVPMFLFICGVVLMLTAAAAELGEVALATRTLNLEVKDIMSAFNSASAGERDPGAGK